MEYFKFLTNSFTFRFIISIRPNIPRLFIAAAALSALCLLPGCIVFYTYKDITVRVQDAETQKPIAGAQVESYYEYFLLLNPPHASTATTDAKGRATLKAASYKPQLWSVRADGYLSLASHDFAARNTTDFRLYQQPEPKVTLVVPNGYTGPLLIDVHPLDNQWIQGQIGKREFEFQTNTHGYVQILATPLLIHYFDSVRLLDVTVRFQDGRNIPHADWRVGPDEVAVRWMPYGSMFQHIFLVGTHADEEKLTQSLELPSPSGGMMSNENEINNLFQNASKPSL